MFKTAVGNASKRKRKNRTKNEEISFANHLKTN